MQETLSKAPPMVGRSIVLTSISCRGVKYFALFQKPSVYAVVSIVGGNDLKKQKQKHKTSTDHEGGENPEWDQAMILDLEHGELQELFLEFRIMAQGNLLGDKLIGKSRALIADLAEGNPSGVVRQVSYQVRSSDGKPNGVLSFSFKLNLPEMEIRLPVLTDSFLTLPAPPPRESLYPPLPLPEDSPANYFYDNKQRTPPDPASYYTPPPPPPQPSVGYYPPSDRAVNIPVSTRDAGYLPASGSSNREYHSPQPSMSASGTYGSSNREYYPPPPASGKYGSSNREYYPPPPSIPASGTYGSSNREYYPPPPSIPASGTYGSSNREYYPPPPSMPVPGTYGSSNRECYPPPPSPGYVYPPCPQDSCCYCNCQGN